MGRLNVDAQTVAVGVGVIVVGVLLWKVGQAVPKAVGAGADMVGGVLTGNNAITQGARTDAYQGAGGLGTLGAATDRILGGVPSRIGESLGGWLYEITH